MARPPNEESLAGGMIRNTSDRRAVLLMERRPRIRASVVGAPGRTGLAGISAAQQSASRCYNEPEPTNERWPALEDEAPPRTARRQRSGATRRAAPEPARARAGRIPSRAAGPSARGRRRSLGARRRGRSRDDRGSRGGSGWRRWRRRRRARLSVDRWRPRCRSRPESGRRECRVRPDRRSVGIRWPADRGRRRARVAGQVLEHAVAVRVGSASSRGIASWPRRGKGWGISATSQSERSPSRCRLSTLRRGLSQAVDVGVLDEPATDGIP